MHPLDWIVIASYLTWIVVDAMRRTRNTDKVEGYFLGGRSLPWWAVGLSVMATQLSAITLVGTTGQAYATGLRFIQFYLGLPIAMIVLSLTVVPFFHRAGVYTAYEYLERRFDVKTRTLAATAVSARADLLARRRPGGAGGGDVGDPRLERPADGAGAVGADGHVHRLRRRAGGGVDRRQADVRGRRRHAGGGRGADLRIAARVERQRARSIWPARPAGCRRSTSGST